MKNTKVTKTSTMSADIGKLARITLSQTIYRVSGCAGKITYPLTVTAKIDNGEAAREKLQSNS